MKRIRPALLFLCALAACADAQGGREEAVMASIEASIRLPAGAGDLESYERVYAWAQSGRKVSAVYFTGGVPGRRWVEASQLPLIMDGGCGVITLTYDVASSRVEGIGCNGLA
jgi:hypothetical protein